MRGVHCGLAPQRGGGDTPLGQVGGCPQAFALS